MIFFSVIDDMICEDVFADICAGVRLHSDLCAGVRLHSDLCAGVRLPLL